MTGVREMVCRDLYRGRIVYGKTRWIDKGGTKVKQDRPEAEWLTLAAPALRIVSDEHLDGLARAAVTWGDDVRGEIRARLADWHGLIGRQPIVARQILRKLLVGRS